MTRQSYMIGDRVQLTMSGSVRGTIIRHVIGGYHVRFDRPIPYAGYRRDWICDPVELEPAMVCTVDSSGFHVHEEGGTT